MKTSHQLGLDHCNQCGECCRKDSCHLDERDASKIAQHLGISRREFARTYLQVFRTSPTHTAVKTRMTASGCIFLKDNCCSIHEVKPKGGRDYECWTPQHSAQQYWWRSSALSSIGVKVELGGAQ